MTTDAKDLIRLKDVLAPWEKKFCEWLVEKHPASVKKTDSAKACSALAGRTVTVAEMNKLRGRRAFRRYYLEVRTQSDEMKKEGLAVFQDTIPDAMRLQLKAVQQMLADPKVDIRAVPSIVAPFNDHVAPKKQLSETHATVVTIHITASQQASLELPSAEIEAEEVEVEFVDG